MFNMNLQFFAHKKGVGSTKKRQRFRIQAPWCKESGRTVCRLVAFFTDSAEPRFIPALMLASAAMTHYLLR